jgi:hypothetical protein
MIRTSASPAGIREEEGHVQAQWAAEKQQLIWGTKRGASRERPSAPKPTDW